MIYLEDISFRVVRFIFFPFALIAYGSISDTVVWFCVVFKEFHFPTMGASSSFIGNSSLEPWFFLIFGYFIAFSVLYFLAVFTAREIPGFMLAVLVKVFPCFIGMTNGTVSPVFIKSEIISRSDVRIFFPLFHREFSHVFFVTFFTWGWMLTDVCLIHGVLLYSLVVLIPCLIFATRNTNTSTFIVFRFCSWVFLWFHNVKS